MKIEFLLKEMVRLNASDLHIKQQKPPTFRINGRLISYSDEIMSKEMMVSLVSTLTNKSQKETLEREKYIDFSVGTKGIGRFRINVFFQRNSLAMVIRYIKSVIPDIEELKLPDVLHKISSMERGLVLVTGVTGSGKSTTLASIINEININEAKTIITIEDPIEYTYKDINSFVYQREIGSDSNSFSQALTAALRQDPDVLLIGEIRDLDTLSTALTAADTGHLVFSTIHTTNCKDTISRLLSMYPADQRDSVRALLSQSIAAIISMRLLPTADGESRVPAVEVLLNTPLIQEYILDEDKTRNITSALSEGTQQYGTQTFDQSIFELFQSNKITKETALKFASNPSDFELKISGVSGISDRSWIQN